jgi:hypothetical protein
MTYIFQQIRKSLSLSLSLTASLAFMLCWPVQTVHAESRVEGRISSTQNSSGLFDLRVEIWNHASSVPQLIQVIDIPKVMVNKGHFQVTIETGIRPESAKDLSMTIQSRGFESWKPFTPVELSSFKST